MKTESPAQIQNLVEEEKDHLEPEKMESETNQEASKDKNKKNTGRQKRNPIERTIDDTLKSMENMLKAEVSLNLI